jgi:putative flippase GtrA
MKLIATFINRELIMYGIVGLATTVVNIGLFELLMVFGMDYRLANTIAIIITIILAYFTNKSFVFCTKYVSWKSFINEFSKFMLTRSGTMLVEWFGLIALVDFFEVQKTISKIAITILVVVLNYVLGKLCVFKKVSSSTQE